ncbi:DUF2829 domain-containing protein [Brevibacillus laterosporus]|nr:DUF2829 domain-containing protein [Brevibacillus laterosporus]TPG74024.1 DUF2829 domain-containing protein [Brevibacillus laterosporus]
MKKITIESDGTIPGTKVTIDGQKTLYLEAVNFYANARTRQVIFTSSLFGTFLDQDFEYDFGTAVSILKQGLKVARRGWNGKGMFLQMINSEDYSIKDTVVQETTLSPLPWIGMKTADDKFVPWLASQTDVLAEDWITVT